MDRNDHAAKLHEAVLRASTSNDKEVRVAYFDLAAFHYRHVDSSSRPHDDAQELISLATECCHERHCWCKKDDHAK